MDKYKLVKLKLKSDLGVEVIWTEPIQNAANVEWVKKSMESSIQRHADMDEHADVLKIHVARIYGLLALGLYKDEEDMSKREKELLADTLESIKIIGVSVSGEDDSLGAVITAKRTVFESKTIIMNTPFMRFNDETYDYCYDLGEAVTRLGVEAYHYIFKRKFAQLELPFDEEPSMEVVPDDTKSDDAKSE